MRLLLALATLTTLSLTGCDLKQDLGGGSGGSSTSSTGEGGATSTAEATSTANATGSGTGGTGGGSSAAGTGGEGGMNGCPAVIGNPIELASNQGLPVGITVDANSVYWTPMFDEVLLKVGKNGGAITELVGNDMKFMSTWQVESMTNDGAYLYWNTVALGNGGIWRMPLSGGVPVKLTDAGIEATDFPQTLGVHGGILYWAGFSTDINKKKMIFSIPVGGGTVTEHPLLDSLGYISAIAPDATGVYFTVYQSGSSDGYVGYLPAGGGGAKKLTAASLPVGLAVDETYVYFGDALPFMAPPDSAALRRVPKAGGPVETLVPGLSGVGSVVLDDVNVYFAAGGPCGATIRSMPKAGGPVVVLANQQKGPLGLAADAGFLYWTNFASNHNGSVMKVAKMP